MLVTKILIVDDEPIMRESLAGWLERDGHYIDTSASGEDALKRVKSFFEERLLVDEDLILVSHDGLIRLIMVSFFSANLPFSINLPTDHSIVLMALSRASRETSLSNT